MNWGISHKRAVMLDYDDYSRLAVVSDAWRLCEKWSLRGFALIESSPKHYHVVFDRLARSYREVCEIVHDSRAYCQKDLLLRERHGCLTLRLSKKRFVKRGSKVTLPAPRLLKIYGSPLRGRASWIARYLAALRSAHGSSD